MKEKSFCLAFVIIALTSSCFSCSAQSEAQKNVNETFNQTNQDIVQAQPSPADKSPVKNKIDTSEWKIYADKKNGFSFRYPPNLILQKKGGKVRLYHFTKYRYQDPCDMRSENPPFLDKLIDFDVTFEIVKKDFASLVEEFQDMEEAPFKIAKLMGKVEGKSVKRTFEFCGSYEYFYPFKKNKSLVIEDKIPGYLYELAYSEAKKTKAWKNPNVIKPEESALILSKILESFNIPQKEKL